MPWAIARCKCGLCSPSILAASAVENFRITLYTLYHNSQAVSSKIDWATFGGLEARRACALTCLRAGPKMDGKW